MSVTKVYCKSIVDNYRCCRCGVTGVRLYRLKFQFPLYCIHCSETADADKPFIKPTPEICTDYWVTAIPAHWDYLEKRMSCCGYLHPSPDGVKWWKCLKEAGTATITQIKRIWI